MADLSVIQIILILLVGLFAGFESVLDEFQLHQPIITYSLIGLITGDLATGLYIGGSLQLVSLDWMNVGAAMAPDVAIAGAVVAILTLAKGAEASTAIAIEISLAIEGLVLTIFGRTLAASLGHFADRQAEEGNIRGVEIPISQVYCFKVYE